MATSSGAPFWVKVKGGRGPLQLSTEGNVLDLIRVVKAETSRLENVDVDQLQLYQSG